MSYFLHDYRLLFLNVFVSLYMLAGVGMLNAQDFRILHYTQTTGWDHQTANESLQMFQELAVANNFAVDQDSDGSSFNNLADLQQYDVIVWANTSGSYNLNVAQRTNFEAYIQAGGSYLGIHAASDTYRHSSANGGDTGFWDFYAEEVCGGSVQNNPNHTAQNFNADLNHTTPHVSTANLPNPWNKDEEYYYWENGYISPNVVDVLQVVSTGTETFDVPRPISWYMNLSGGGRSFYTALGHDPSDYTSPNLFRTHILDALMWVANSGANNPVSISGELKKWHTVSLTFEGPNTNEDDPYNPFLNYRMDVTFSQGAKSYTVAGYYAADGNAAETSASTGNKWRVHFTPDEVGTWSYQVSFRTGTNVAVDDNPLAGTATSIDGSTGSFDIVATDKTGNDFRAKGRLEYVDQRYLRFAETGEYFFKGGANSPENFLGYFEFDNTYDNGGNGNALHTTEPYISQGQNFVYAGDGLHHYEAHLSDWQNGDPSWQNGKGKGIIGAINYLSSKEVNSLYFLTMNVDGDGREVFPWTEYWIRDRFDVSKLDQWEIVFAYMEQKGIAIQAVLQEQENDQLLDGGFLGTNRKLYLRELIARFGHHLGLLWNLGEENTNTDQQRRDMAEYFDRYDAYHHFIGVHTFIGQQQDIYGQLVGYQYVDGASLQMDLMDIHTETEKWVRESQLANRKWVVFSDEIGPFQTGVSPDGPGNNHADIRYYALYGNLFAGGGGTEWYFGYDEAQNDLDCEDFRARDQMWDYTRIARQFMQDHSTFLAMRPADELIDNNQGWCFAWDSVAYLIYLPYGGTTNLDLQGYTGTYAVNWFNPRTGGALQNGSIDSLSGPGQVNIGTPPTAAAEDWIAIVGNPAALMANTSPGFQLSGDITLAENFPATEQITVTEDPVSPGEISQTVTYSLSPSSVTFANVSIDPATGTVSITAVTDSSGSQSFVVIADDGQAYNNIATDTFMLVVQPEIVNSNAIRINSGGQLYTANAGEIYEADRDFVGGNTFISQLPIANTLDDTLYHSERTAGNFTYAIPVNNGQYIIRLHFAEIFHPSAGNRVMDVSLEGNLVMDDYDIVADVGNFTATIKEFPVTIADGIVNLNFTASVDQAKVSAIEIISDTTTVNTPPSFSLSQNNLSLDEDFNTTEIIIVTPDPITPGEEGQAVSYSLSPAMVPFANVTINDSTGEVSITSVPNASGTQLFTITADDGQAANNLATESFTLTVNPINDSPTFTTSGDISVDENFQGTEIVTVITDPVPNDEQTQIVLYSLVPGTVSFANVVIDPLSGTVSITAVPNANGSQTFMITANDGQLQNNISSEFFTLTVNPLNQAPTFVMSGDLILEEDFVDTQQLTATPDPVPPDELGQTVTYSMFPPTVPFANVSIDPFTGVVTVLASQDLSGSQTFTVTANDGEATNNTATDNFLLTVSPVNDPPSFTLSGDINVNENFLGTEVVTVTPDPIPIDETGQTVTYSLFPASVGFANVSIDTLTGEVSITAMANQSGSQLFSIIADDGQAANNTATQTFTLTVNLVNNTPPGFTLSGDITVDEDFGTTEIVTVIPDSVPAAELGQVVTYSMLPSSVSFANVSIDPTSGEVNVVAVADGNGSQVFTVTANDGQTNNNIATATFTLNVNPVNDAPNFTYSGDISAVEDFVGTNTVSVTPFAVPQDEQGQTVTYSLMPATVPFANISIDSVTGLVSVTSIPDEVGSQLFSIQANDGQAQNNLASISFFLNILQVNDEPSFTLSGDIVVDENFPGTEMVIVTPDPIKPGEQTQVVLYALDPPSVSFANVSIDENTGNVSITAIPNFYGTQIFTIYANDGSFPNNVYAQTFTLTVNQINNTPPTFSLSGDVLVNENFNTTKTVTLTPDPVPPDEANQSVTYSINPTTVPFANVVFDSSTGEVTITAVADANGTQVFTITADDGATSNNTATGTFTLTVAEVNTPPSFTHTGDITADEDFVGQRTLILTSDPVPPDEATQVVSYSLSPTSVPFANVSFDTSTGLVTITAVADSNGSQVFSITADDGQAANNIYSSSFTLTILPQNDAPQFSMSGDVVLDEDFATTEIVSPIPNLVPDDETNQTVTYSIFPTTVSFANISFDAATGIVGITAVPNGNGSRSFTITADDGQVANNIASSSFTLTINPLNDAPTFVMSGDVNVAEDFTTTEVVTAIPDPVPSDELTQTVTYSISPASVSFANIVFDPTTGNLSITSIPDASGTQVFTITADDGQAANNIATTSFTLSVNSVNNPPTFSISGDITVGEDFVSTETVTVTPDPVAVDEQDQTVTYSLLPPIIPFANISIDTATGQVTITAIADMSGTQTFTIVADDGQPEFNQATQTFTLTVDPINDLPVFVMSGNLMLDEDFPGTETVSVIQGPVPADEASQMPGYSLNPASVSFANVSIEPATGTVSIMAVANASGSQTFTVTADDGQGENNIFMQTFMLEIGPINDAPSFTHTGDISVSENFTTAETLTINPDLVPLDEQSQVVSYSLDPPTVSFANIVFDPSTGNLSITSVQDSSGLQNFTITANDGQAENNLYTQTFTLTVNSVNNPPTFVLSGDVIVDEDFPATETVSISPDPVPSSEISQLVSYSLEPATVSFANISINASTGMVSISAIPDSVGNQEFVIIANDGQAENNIARDTFSLVINPINDPPTFTLGLSGIEVEEDFEGTASITPRPDPVPLDEQSQVVSYSLDPPTVSFANIVFDSFTGEIQVSAVSNASGEQTFSLIANDGQSDNHSDTTTFFIRILSTNDAPEFSISGDVTVPWNFETTEIVSVNPGFVPDDERNQVVMYSLEPANVSFANIVFNPNTGEVQITAVQDSFGTQLFVISANDGQSLNNTASQSFTLTVEFPSVSSLRINAGADRDMAFGQYLFIADTFHSGGDEFYNPHIKDILGTTWDELYRSERIAPTGVNSFLYTIPLVNGEYYVYLHFAETYWGAFGGGCCGNVGQRVYHVEVEEVPELVGFDMLTEVGPMTALVKKIPVMIKDGFLNLKFEAVEDRPSIKAIEILIPKDTLTSISRIENPNNPFVDPIYTFGTDPTPGEGNILIYPNPVPNDLTVLVENEMDGKLEVFIYDSFGKRYKKFLIDKKGRWATYTFPVDDLIPGYYVIHFLEADTGLSIARKFWKVK